MPPIPPGDQQSAPTRGDLALMLTAMDARVQALQTLLSDVMAAVINTQALASDALAAAGAATGEAQSARAAVLSLNDRLTGNTNEPGGDTAGWCGAILTAARTD